MLLPLRNFFKKVYIGYLIKSYYVRKKNLYLIEQLIIVYDLIIPHSRIKKKITCKFSNKMLVTQKQMLVKNLNIFIRRY